MFKFNFKLHLYAETVFMKWASQCLVDWLKSPGPLYHGVYEHCVSIAIQAKMCIIPYTYVLPLRLRSISSILRNST